MNDTGAAMAEHRRDAQWGVTDFIGKFHLSRMTTPNPIPGTSTRVEQERNTFLEKRASSLQKTLDNIEARRRLRVRGRTRKAAITARVEVQATVGYRMGAVQRMYQSAAGTTKKQISTAKYAPDADFRALLKYVETNNVYQVRSRLRDRSSSGSSYRLVATADEKYGNTLLHRAVSLGFAEICSVLLEAGADLDAVNTMGDAPIHCCWRFWKGDSCKYVLWRKNPYLMTTKKMKEDFARMERDIQSTVSLLRLLTRGGADVDAQRNNGEVALHTAARRGPFMALWILLLSQATHDIIDHRHFTPETAAIRAGNEDAKTLLATWPVARLKYRNSEFVQEWMKFLTDPEANLTTDLTAKEVLAQVRMEEHEESTAVRARGGHLLVDEIITGPVLSAEQRARAKILNFSASDPVTIASTLENSTNNTNSVKSCSGSNCGPSPSGTRESDEGGEEGDKGGDKERRQQKTKSKLGKEIDVYLAQARDEAAGVRVGGLTGQSTAYSRLVAKEQLEGRRNRWPGIRDNGKDPPTGGAGSGCSGDPFGRPMTTSQRRRVAALEVAEDGGIESPLIRAATSSALLTTRSRAMKKESTPHPFYGRRLLTQRLLNQREREASIKPTATIGMNKGLDPGGRKRALYLNDTRTAFNDHELLPDPNDPGGVQVEEAGRLHALHPAMQWRKLHERPFSELQGSRDHSENVYDSILENYCPRAWNAVGAQEPLLPVRRHGPYK
ncbi:unnamed protein product [Ectocarpus sp. 4 AP-2014]